MDIAEFLLARFGEDEARARSAAAKDPAPWTVELYEGEAAVLHNADTFVNSYGHRRNRLVFTSDSGWGDAEAWLATTEHVARWDPARVLAKCEADRAIVNEHYRTQPSDDGDFSSPERCILDGEVYPCRTVRLLAAVYADHPDYDPAWALEVSAPAVTGSGWPVRPTGTEPPPVLYVNTDGVEFANMDLPFERVQIQGSGVVFSNCRFIGQQEH